MDDDLDDYKLDTIFEPDHVLHVTYKSDRDRGYRKLRVEQRWFSKAELGSGSFGTVRLQTTGDGQQRAVKAVRKTATERYGIDYRRELAALTTFSRAKFAQHEIFVKFFGWFEDPEFIFLAMEFLPLGDLSNFKDQDLLESDVKLICIQLLEGLEIMHDKGFTHRDLKPQNIFVVQSMPWWVKIGDFGITKRVRPDNTTQLRTTTGTQGYEAPEIRGYVSSSLEDEESDDEDHVYTSAVDIWSLGCIIYELVTHQLPFPTMRILKRFCDGKNPFPNGMLGADIHPMAVEFIRSLLTREPPRRPTATSALGNIWFTLPDEDIPRNDNSSQQQASQLENPTITQEPHSGRFTILRKPIQTRPAGLEEPESHQTEMKPVDGTTYQLLQDPDESKTEQGLSELSTSSQSEPLNYEEPLVELAASDYGSKDTITTESSKPEDNSIAAHDSRKSPSKVIPVIQHQSLDTVQKPSKLDPRSWLKKFKINRDKTPPSQEIEQIPRIFGVPLRASLTHANAAITLQDSEGKPYVYGYLPIVVAKVGVWLKEHGLLVEDIFVTQGDPIRVQELRAIFDSPPRYGKGIQWDGYTVHDAACLLLQFLDSLPEPLIPFDVCTSFARWMDTYENFVDDIDINPDRSIKYFQELFAQLPELNRHLLLYLLDLWAVVASKSDSNRMSAQRIADVFHPKVLFHPNHNETESKINKRILIFLIINQDDFLIGAREGIALNNDRIWVCVFK